MKEVGAPPFSPLTSPVLSMLDNAAVGAEGGSVGWRGSRALPSSRGKLVVAEELLPPRPFEEPAGLSHIEERTRTLCDVSVVFMHPAGIRASVRNEKERSRSTLAAWTWMVGLTIGMADHRGACSRSTPAWGMRRSPTTRCAPALTLSPPSPPTLEATQGQIDIFLGQIP